MMNPANRHAAPDPGWATPARLVFVALIVVVCVQLFDAITRTLLIAYAAAVFAIVLNTAVRRIPFERTWATAAVGIVIVAALVSGLWFGGSVLLDQLRGLLDQLPRIENAVRGWAASIQLRTGLRLDALSDPLNNAINAVTTGGGGVLSRVQGVFGVIALILVVFFGGLFALARPNERLLTPLMRALPPRHHDATRRMLELLAKRLVGWAQGQALAMLIVGVMATILFSIIGVPYAVLLGLFNGLTEFIPILGPWIGGIAAIIIAAVEDPTLGAMTAAAAVFIQMVENTLLLPMLMNERAHVHPYISLLALLFFGAAFGFLGVLLAIPLVLLIWTVTQVFWVEAHLHTERERIEPVVDE